MAFEKRGYTIGLFNVPGRLDQTIPVVRILHKMRMRGLQEDLDPLQWGNNCFGLHDSCQQSTVPSEMMRLTAQPAIPPASPFFKATSKFRLPWFDFDESFAAGTLVSVAPIILSTSKGSK